MRARKDNDRGQPSHAKKKFDEVQKIAKLEFDRTRAGNGLKLRKIDLIGLNRKNLAENGSPAQALMKKL
jgi:hypothetical protein